MISVRIISMHVDIKPRHWILSFDWMIYFRGRWVLKGMNWSKVDVKERWQMEWTTRRSDSITERITSSAFTLLQDATIPMWNQSCQTFVKIPNQTSSSWTPVCGTSAGESLRPVIFNIRVKVYGLYGFVGHSRHSGDLLLWVSIRHFELFLML